MQNSNDDDKTIDRKEGIGKGGYRPADRRDKMSNGENGGGGVKRRFYSGEDVENKPPKTSNFSSLYGESSNWSTYEEFMEQADSFILDQIRLLSLEYLYRKTVEYHHNHYSYLPSRNSIHVVPSTSVDDRGGGSRETQRGYNPCDHFSIDIKYENMIEIHYFDDPMVLQPSSLLNYSQLATKLEKKLIQSEYPIWLHLLDLHALPLVASYYQLNDYFTSLFSDLRGHSVLLTLPGSLLVTICNVRMIGSTAHLFKIYLYADQRILLTFEREIFPEVEIHETEADRIALENELKELLICSTATSAKHSFQRKFRERFGMGKHGREREEVRNYDSERGINDSTHVLDDDREDMIWRDIVTHHTAIESLRAKEYRESVASYITPTQFTCIQSFRSLLCGKTYLSSRRKDVGSLLLLFEIVLYSNSSSNGVVEVLSRALSHMKRQVTSRVTVSDKRIFYHHLANLLFAAKMTRRIVDEVYSNFQRLQDLRHADHSLFFSLSRVETSSDLRVALSLVVDSFAYRSSCLSTQTDDVLALESVMTHMNTMSAESTSKNLGLVATVFLPLTFLAGVFGMNFQENGGYTMGILNAWYGPEVFWALCILVVCMNFYFFLVSGLMNLRKDPQSCFGYRIDETESDITSDQEKLMKKTQQLERVNSLLMKKMQMKSTSSAQYSSTYHLSTSSQHAPDWRE